MFYLRSFGTKVLFLEFRDVPIKIKNRSENFFNQQSFLDVLELKSLEQLLHRMWYKFRKKCVGDFGRIYKRT